MLYEPYEVSPRPRLLLAYADSAYAARIGRTFRRLGWEVRLVSSAAEARRLVAVYTPTTVLLETTLAEESGWSVAARIHGEHPEQRLVLLATDRSHDARERLTHAGAAAVVTRADGMEGLVRAVYGHTLAKAV